MSQFRFPFQVRVSNQSRKWTKPTSSHSGPIFKQSRLVTPTLETKLVQTATLGAMYCIPKTSLSDLQVKQLCQDLTVTYDAETPFKKKQSTPYQAYVETTTHFQVPRFYGIETFGIPARVELSLGQPMHASIECKIVLDATRQQPQAAQYVENALRKSYQWGGFLSLPCGYGKTLTALYIAIETIRRIESHPRRTLVIVPDSNILSQWFETLRQYVPGARVGILRQNRIEIEEHDFVVAMVHSVAKRDYPHLNSFGFVIFDEAHHMVAPLFSRVLQKLPAKYILALTATPCSP